MPNWVSDGDDNPRSFAAGPTRYFFVCPRGFANERSFYRIPADRAGEIESHFEGRGDLEFDAGNTRWHWDWIASPGPQVVLNATDWDVAKRAPEWAHEFE